MPPTSVFEHHVYSGFEPAQAFGVIYGGHFEHRLMSAKRSTLEHLRLVLGDVRLETGRYDFPVIAQGVMPQESVCIGMVADGIEITRYNTEFIAEDEIQVYSPGVELMYDSSGASRWITMTVPRSTLQAAAHERAGISLPLPRRGVAAFQLARGKRAYLRQVAEDAFGLARALQPEGIAPDLAQEMSRSMVAAYVDALCAAELTHRNVKASTARRHYHLIMACEKLVLSAGAVDVDLSEIARASGYSLRSVERIFRRGVGMTPGRWFTNIRLNGALRDLLAPTALCSITDVATRWGFRHLSRFAQQYRQAFGELPNQTLARARHET